MDLCAEGRRSNVRRLIFENPCFRVHIRGESAMTIQVVGSDVEHDRNGGVKCTDGFKLKTGMMLIQWATIPVISVGVWPCGDWLQVENSAGGTSPF